MYSSIYLDGAALWVVLAMMAAVFVTAVVMGCGYIEEARENDRLKRELKKHIEIEEELAEALYKRGFMRDVAQLGEPGGKPERSDGSTDAT